MSDTLIAIIAAVVWIITAGVVAWIAYGMREPWK